MGRGALPGRPDVGRALPPAGAPRRRQRAPPHAARPARRRTAPHARSRHPGDRARRHDVEVAVVMSTRRRAGRDGAHAIPRARDGVRDVAGRMRDGLHLLRDRPGRFRTAPRRERDRRTGRASRTRLATAGQQCRLHGNGRTPRELRPDVGGGRAHPRRPRAVGATHHRQHGRRGPPHPTPRARGPSRDARGLAARGDRRGAQRPRTAQPALSDRRGPRRRRRVRGRQGAPRHLRVRVHRRRERLAGPRRGTRALAQCVSGRRRRPREPDPAQSDRRVRWPRAARALTAGLRRAGPEPWCVRDRAPESWYRHRRGLRPAAVPGGDAPGIGVIGHNVMVNQWKWVNQFQPQTLYMATILCYVDAVFGLLFGFGTSLLAALVIVALLGFGGFGIANEKKWGYAVAVTGAVLQVVMLFAVYGVGVLTSLAVISFLFDAALVALLLHPMSREYQRIWFK